MTRRIIALSIAALLLWLTVPSAATANAPFIFQTDMYGRNEVPPVETVGYGFVRFFFSDNRLEADYTVDVKGLSQTLVEGADIHRGIPGEEGPVVRHLADGGFIVTSGRLRLTPAELEEMLSGVWYVSVKTKGHPEGEMRGQVVAPSGFLPTPPTPVPLVPTPPVSPPPQPPVDAPPPQTVTGIRPPNTGDAGLVTGGPEAAWGAHAPLLLAASLLFVRRYPRGR